MSIVIKICVCVCIYIYLFILFIYWQLFLSAIELGQNTKKVNIQCDGYYLKMYVSCNAK